MSRKSNSDNFEAGRRACRDGDMLSSNWNEGSAWRKGYDFEAGIQDHKDGDTRISWSKNSDYGKGYDYEGERQAKKEIDDSIDFIHGCLGFPNSSKSSKPSKPSRPSGSSGGGGSGLAGIGVGGVIFLFFVLLCLFSIVGDAIDSLTPPSTNEIAAEKIRMEKLDIENSICRWMDETSLRDGLIQVFPDYGYGFRLEYYTMKDSNIWATVHAVYPSKNHKYGRMVVELKMHSVDAGDSWEIC